MKTGWDPIGPVQLEAELREDWSQRQQTLGNTTQAVLLRNLPEAVNALLDRWHRVMLRWALAPVDRSGVIADLGCGYGRLASEARAVGFPRVVGLDYEPGFCASFRDDYKLAVRGSVAHPPFAPGSLDAAYAVTTYMYLGTARAREGLAALDACLVPGARILLLEAGAGFNRLARAVFRKKAAQQLAVEGFSSAALGGELLPAGWRVVGSGGNPWTTLCLPLLLALPARGRLFRCLADAAADLDAPQAERRDRGWRRIALHRWVVCEKGGADHGGLGFHNSHT